MRQAGVLMPIYALPSRFGVGDFGENAYKWVDLLKKSGFKLWQILPLNPLGYGHSPYQPFSSRAMDEVYVDLEELVSRGLIKKVPSFKAQNKHVDYEAVRSFKRKYVKEALMNFKEDRDFRAFMRQDWVFEYAVFMTFKEHNHNKAWQKWETPYKNWIYDKKLDLSPFEEEIRYHVFVEYLLLRSFKKLKRYANSKGIRIIGDMPFYVGLDSVDVYTYQEGFILNEDGSAKLIAGVPPDYFSKDGQRWGNPIYDWEHLKNTGYDFWIDRLYYSSTLFDIIRIDHFRAFDTYYVIDAKETTARHGSWVLGPSYDFFDTLFNKYPHMEIIAEDLGDLRDEVHLLRDHYDLRGMRVLEFSLDLLSEEDKTNLIVYTGTHDNETLYSFLKKLGKRKSRQLAKDLDTLKIPGEDLYDRLINYCLSLKAEYVIFPYSDLLRLTNKARINEPGLINDKNWCYRLNSLNELEKVLISYKPLLKRYKR